MIRGDKIADLKGDVARADRRKKTWMEIYDEHKAEWIKLAQDKAAEASKAAGDVRTLQSQLDDASRTVEALTQSRDEGLKNHAASLKKIAELEKAVTTETRINVEQLKQRNELMERVKVAEGRASYLERKIANVRAALIDADKA